MLMGLNVLRYRIISAIRSYYVRFGQRAGIFDHSQITMFITAVQKSTPFSVKIPHLIDIDLFKVIIQNCEHTYMG